MANMISVVDGIAVAPRNVTKFTALLLKARQRFAGEAGDNTITKTPLTVQAANGQTANLVEVCDSNNNSAAVLLAVDAAGGLVQGSGLVSQRVVRVALTAAQITTLHSVPVQLLAAPGAGFAILPTAMAFEFTYGTVQFTGGGAVNPVYHGQTTNHLGGSVAAATIQAAANAYISCGAPAAALALLANTGVDLYAATADFAAGDSTAVVKLSYDLITLG